MLVPTLYFRMYFYLDEYQFNSQMFLPFSLLIGKSKSQYVLDCKYELSGNSHF
uniref:Uncharacterized protein n=1 Tax=Anguilla anguilla TaxID=7936 RepID=A0A0E9WF00_ANGAN